MTSSAARTDVRHRPRFTFAGRGCRDPRREVRRLPQALRLRSPSPSTVTPSPVASRSAEAGRPSAGPSSTTGSSGPAANRDDRPPPAALRYGPARGSYR